MALAALDGSPQQRIGLRLSARSSLAIDVAARELIDAPGAVIDAGAAASP
jgi:hypothetical protein